MYYAIGWENILFLAFCTTVTLDWLNV